MGDPAPGTGVPSMPQTDGPGEPARLAQDHRTAGPTVLRMVVGAQLRRYREAAGISTEAAGYEIRASHSKISRMELGRVRFKERDVADLLTLYGVTEPGVREPLLELAEHAGMPNWWQRYGDVVPSWFEPYLGLEQGAEVVRVYGVLDVPELLQIPDYARALLTVRHPEARPEEVERRVELRMRRRRVFERSDPPRLWAVLDEAALCRMVGGAATMRAQIEHLIELVARPNITVQILPFAAGGHAAEGGPVTLLRFAEPELPDVVYLEQLTGALYPDRPAEIARYRDVLNRVGVQAEPPARTRQLLQKALARIP